MWEHTAPRVKLPDNIPRKPMIPGPNSWAQSLEQEKAAMKDQELKQSINRERYEDKAMPQTWPEDPPNNPNLPKKKYIKPAIPLANPSSSHKDRAVTDPVAPKPLFATRKASVDQLRRKFSGFKTDDSQKEDRITSDEFSAYILATGKAAQVLGMHTVPGTKNDTPHTSAPLPVNKNETNRISSEDLLERLTQSTPVNSQERDSTPIRQAQPTPIPTRRFLRENNLSSPTQTPVFTTSSQGEEQASDSELRLRKLSGTELENGPTAAAGYQIAWDMGEVKIGEGESLHRVPSCTGVIEDVHPPERKPNWHSAVGSVGTSPQASNTQGECDGGLLRPMMYSPSEYGGVWENNPAVGHSLPPLTPMLKEFPHALEPEGRAHLLNSRLAIPFVAHGSSTSAAHQQNSQKTDIHIQSAYQSTHGFDNYLSSLPSANSWATDSRGNSIVSNERPLSALLPPRWPHHHTSNSVPSPPHTQNDYQRSGPMSAGLAHLDLTLHHHIDTAFGALSRLITDKHDRTLDLTIRRIETIEDNLSKGFNRLKIEMKNTKGDIKLLRGAIDDVAKADSTLKEMVQGLEGNLGGLERCIEEHACNCQQLLSGLSTSDPESDRQQRPISNRRTESANGALGYSDQRQQYPSGTSRSSNSTRQSGASVRRNRSNTQDGRSTKRASDERSMREFFAELGTAKGPVPDLRNHPAYAEGQERRSQVHGQDKSGTSRMLPVPLPYAPQPLGDGGWYHQAYGQGDQAHLGLK